MADAPLSSRDAAVVFPVHDTRIVKIESLDAALAEQVADRDGPALICLHPEDLDDPEKARIWTRFGHTVVSAGGRRDALFLGRILSLVRSARRVVSNQLSTAVLYAAAEGTDTAIYGPDASNGALGTGIAERTRELWPEFHDDAGASLRRSIALRELGQSHLLDADQLRTTLGWNHRSPGPFVNYWAGAPVRKAGAVLGLVKRPEGAQDPGAGVSPLVFLRHPLSHLPGVLPKLPNLMDGLPAPLAPRVER
jgi:hypothetical protein